MKLWPFKSCVRERVCEGCSLFTFVYPLPAWLPLPPPPQHAAPASLGRQDTAQGHTRKQDKGVEGGGRVWFAVFIEAN